MAFEHFVIIAWGSVGCGGGGSVGCGGGGSSGCGFGGSGNAFATQPLPDGS